jgi:hypothetical protein
LARGTDELMLQRIEVQHDERPPVQRGMPHSCRR